MMIDEPSAASFAAAFAHGVKSRVGVYDPRFSETDVTFAVKERLGWDDINVFPESVYIEHDCDHEEPYVVDGHVFYGRKAVRYVPERTCRMVDCGSHDTCVVNRQLTNGNIVSMEFGYKQCSECGAYVFDCPTVRYCPSCGARVIGEETGDAD